MRIKELQLNWNQFGRTDPLYAILTYQGKQGNRWSLDEFFELGEKEIDDLMSYIGSLGLVVPRGKALDFGCGVGRLTQALSSYFNKVSGLDIAPSMIELASTYNQCPSKCFYYLNEAINLKIFKDDSLDFIYSNITLQHMEPQYSRKYIEEFIRILSPSGLLVFQLPTAPPWISRKTPRQSIKSALPIGLLNIYRKLRYGGIKPVMQMYGIDKVEVVKLLNEQGAGIAHTKQEPMAEEGWSSYLYFVRKTPPQSQQ